MRFQTPSDPALWYTIKSTDGSPDFAALVKIPALTELLRVQARYGLNTAQPDFSQYAREIAKRWFVEFRGCECDDGSAMPNTLENRVMLLENKAVFDLVAKALNDSGEWRAEGNAVAG